MCQYCRRPPAGASSILIEVRVYASHLQLSTVLSSVHREAVGTIVFSSNTNRRFSVNYFLFGLITSSMSTLPTAAPSSLANFRSVFQASLRTYEKHTKTDLLAHPLAAQLHNCDSPASILTILQGEVQEADQARRRDERLTKWLDPTINVLLAFSDAIGEGVSLVNLHKKARVTCALK